VSITSSRPPSVPRRFAAWSSKALQLAPVGLPANGWQMTWACSPRQVALGHPPKSGVLLRQHERLAGGPACQEFAAGFQAPGGRRGASSFRFPQAVSSVN